MVNKLDDLRFILGNKVVEAETQLTPAICPLTSTFMLRHTGVYTCFKNIAVISSPFLKVFF